MSKSFGENPRLAFQIRYLSDFNRKMLPDNLSGIV